MPQIAEYDRPDATTLCEEIYPGARPAILRGVGAELEPVRIARQGTEAFARYLKDAIGETPVNVLAARPDAGPTFFFDGDPSRLNFERGRMPFARFIDHVLAPDADRRMVYIESTKAEELSVDLARAIQLPLAPPNVPPLVWLGNRTGTHTHFDVQQNIACFVAGRRRFTLFPPEQTPNLYMAPLERSPSSAPVSMVRLEGPDFERYPRFRKALDQALVAELEPGDAIFIPYMWWHHVRALEPFNMLVNYWWNEHDAMGAPIDAMLHAILVLRDLPPPMRDAWRTMFETFVFKAHGEPMDHLEPGQQGGLGPIDGRMRMQMWQTLGSGLSEVMRRVFAPGNRG
ncbi:cupin-like domain-containing protein [Qipengyuania oceanensis]|uniref:Cupin-like domain-containing protein n=1 Tax=Qipengyuania oceanensis TaxID=1463597 RepID=A0A844YJZ3_9SPHN|nr:cupin-like domain-containing protein [Qipengyuania oceanensis]MXO63358.1 cupin-like domain-containing protein [Qipengyuania oceanensis]